MNKPAHSFAPAQSKAARDTIISAVLVALLVLETLFRFGPLIGISNAIIAILTVTTSFLFLLAHGSQTLGWRNLVAYFVIAVVVSFALEAIGVATGIVFGHYYYTNQIGPKLLGVPPLIQLAYAAMGYASLMIARVLLDVRKTPVRLGSILGVTLLAAMIMVAWDLTIDPYQSTVSGVWIWQNGGQYFGVGIHNFVGWLVAVFVFMFLYQLYAARFPEQPNPSRIHSRFFLSQPSLFYAAIGLGTIVPAWIGGFSLPYASPANYSGTLNALEYSVALITVFVMGIPVVASLLHLWGVARSDDTVSAV